MEKARLLPPQVTQIAWELSDFGVPRDLLWLPEIRDAILKIVGGRL